MKFYNLARQDVSHFYKYCMSSNTVFKIWNANVYKCIWIYARDLHINQRTGPAQKSNHFYPPPTRDANIIGKVYICTIELRSTANSMSLSQLPIQYDRHYETGGLKYGMDEYIPLKFHKVRSLIGEYTQLLYVERSQPVPDKLLT